MLSGQWSTTAGYAVGRPEWGYGVCRVAQRRLGSRVADLRWIRGFGLARPSTLNSPPSADVNLLVVCSFLALRRLQLFRFLGQVLNFLGELRVGLGVFQLAALPVELVKLQFRLPFRFVGGNAPCVLQDLPVAGAQERVQFGNPVARNNTRFRFRPVSAARHPG